MSGAERLTPMQISIALEAVRDAAPAIDVDDEYLALLIERGIDAVPEGARAQLLLAIGRHPEISATVAQLSQVEGGVADAGSPLPLALGVPKRYWRVALAACAALMVGLIVWTLNLPGESGGIILSDGSSTPSAPATAGPWLVGRRLVMAFTSLGIVMAVLAILSWWPSAGTRATPSRVRSQRTR